MNTKTKELATIPVVAVIVGLMAGSVAGLELWLAGCVMAAVFVALLGVRFVKQRMAAADLRARRDIRMDENNRCSGCNGDLWGLDVKPGKGGMYRVKCGECGSVNVIARPERRKADKRAMEKRRFEDADRGPFKIR